MNKKVPLLMLLIVLSCYLRAYLLQSPLEYTLNQFLEKVVPPAEQAAFRGYYSRFLDRHSKMRNAGKRQSLRGCRVHALGVLKERYPGWYELLIPYSNALDQNSVETRKARLFLTRIAVYDSFCHRADQKGLLTLWDYVKMAYARVVPTVKEKVTHFTGFVLKKLSFAKA